ncbi:MAG: DUF6291 domain-containing protein [Oscillospiraceae bacterium]|nr:DUF6291 domain-containing protein [Oscillospiraceae bacterium]
MKLTYFKVYADFIGIAEALDNGERGKLFLAILQYVNGKEPDELTGGAKIAYISMKSQIDREALSISDVSSKRSEAGKRGAQARWSKQSGSSQNQVDEWQMPCLPYGKMANDGKHGYNKDEDKDKDKDKDKDEDEDVYMRMRARESTPPPRQENCAQNQLYNPELGRVMSHLLDSMDGTPSERCRGELAEFVATLGADVCIYGIDAAKDTNTEPALSWAYIRAVLRRYKADGLITVDAVRQSEARWEQRKTAKAQSAAGSSDCDRLLQMIADGEFDDEQTRNG